MNNKGFAITALLYGLSILGMMIIAIIMGTIAMSRRNVVEQAEHVEEYLINLNKASGVYTAASSTFVVPKGESGWYRVEAFGKSGGGGNGSYTTGIIYLKEDEEYTIFNESTGSGIKTQSDDILMKAGADNGTTIGGGIRCYSTAPNSSANVLDHQELATDPVTHKNKTLSGIDEVSFSDSGCYTSYIAGYPGSDINNDISTEKMFFVDGLILPGASGVTAGKVIINRLANKDSVQDIRTKMKNKAFQNVSKIISSTPGYTVYYSYHTEDNRHYRIVNCPGVVCNTASENIDEISILPQSGNEKNSSTSIKIILKHTDGSSDTIIYDGSSYGTTLGDTGVHISAYQPPSDGGAFPDHGNYYLIPVVKETGVITADNDRNNALTASYITGDTNQRWSIDIINDNFPMIKNVTPGEDAEYRIMDLSQYKAMSITSGENYENQEISAAETFNSLSRNTPQIWNIQKIKDGTVSIKTVVPQRTTPSGHLYANPNDNKIYIGSSNGNDPKTIERFYAYSLEIGG